MLRQYCFLNASATKISSRHSLKAGTITTQHLTEATTHKTTNNRITNQHLIEAATPEPTNQHITNLHLMYVTRLSINFYSRNVAKKH